MFAKPFVFIYVLAVAIHMVTNPRERDHMTVSWVAFLLVRLRLLPSVTSYYA
jgi:hypothetical protein